MFETSSLNRKNEAVQRTFKIALGGMTAILILPVILIMSMLIYKGGPVISFEFLFASPTQGMTAGGIFPLSPGAVKRRRLRREAPGRFLAERFRK